MEGSLSKWTNVMKGWQYRWFVLDDNAGLLSYYTSKEKMMRGVRRGCVRLRGAVIGIDDEDDSTFTITVDHKTFHFQARNCDERERWVRALEETIARHGRRGGSARGALAGAAPAAAALAGQRPPQLERKVAEADAYFQIMIDQVKKLEERVNSISDEDQKSKCHSIHEQATAMLENIMHSIALLQIAKNTVHPVNGIYTGPTNTSSSVSAMDSDDDSWINFNNDSSVMSAPSTTGIELGAECRERRHSNLQRALTGTSMVLSVPETSYSSSEEDDDFFDADDQDFGRPTSSSAPQLPQDQKNASHPYAGQFSVSPQAAVTSPPAVQSKETSKADSAQAQSRREDTTSIGAPSQDLLQQIDQHVMLPRTKEGKIDYDALYDAESDNESEDMESHGSVVTHVLSQVKIGMDLTKVVLPTFILERRSLLEMYADYFAHPDQFLKIVDMQTPHERMVQVVRWYLSSYHAGRKSAVAKKPYNPILGEIFRCYWDAVDESSASETDRNIDTNTDIISPNNTHDQHDGPIPWCNTNQLSFIAEQVSHHPPISAFYAEHVEKRIQFDAWVWTKSKFLGLSIGVQNIGKGIVTLLDHDEEYVLTFPNGYGRSILTIPWIELGGPVSVECPQTGHKAQIEFITKPFYGGKKHRVTCEIHSPEDKRPYYTATGEWNTRMEARWTESGRTDVLFDVSTMRAHRKRVSPVLKQTERESRRIWRHVTAALRARDEDAATRAKRYVEQAQRDAVREREEQSIVWQTQFFSEQVDEDGWMYMNPLKIRLHRHKKHRTTALVSTEKQPPAPHILNPR